MPGIRALAVFVLAFPAAWGATFGTVVAHPSALADLALDEARSRLYVVNTGANAVEVYNTATNPPHLAYTIPTDATPAAIAMSRSGNTLYVACYAASSLDVVDLTTTAFRTSKIALAASPEAVAVGFNEKVLISTIGTGTGQDVLITYDPGAAGTQGLQAIPVAPPAPSVPVLSPSNMVQANHARLQASADGRTIVGVHELANNTRTVFVFDVSSSTVLRSRNLSVISPVLAVSPDGSQFLSGPTLFETATLLVLAQQSAANAPFVFPATANFNTQTSQGGAIYARTPLGDALLTAYNIVPQLSPLPASNTSQLLVNSTGNLLVQLGIMLPETLAGKMVITSNSSTAYAISQSGFMVLPIGALLQQPIAMPDTRVALLASDQCGVTAAQNSAVIPVRNLGGGRISTLSAQALTGSTTPAAVRSATATYGANVTVSFNAAAGRAIGTATPDQLLLQAAEIVNIVPNVRVYQNSRNAEARGTVIPIDTGATATGLTDMVQDGARQRLYIANPGLNRVEVFDIRQQQLLNPIPVGQLPRSLAMGSDGNVLYVANSGSEMISIVDLNQGAVTGRTQLPPTPFNGSLAVLTPQIIAMTQRGLQALMSDGTLWKLADNTLEPRTLNLTVFGTTRTIAGPQSMAATPDGAFLLVLAGNGTGYLYDSTADDFVSARAVIATAAISGYFGAIAAGPGGQYYVANNQVLNAALTPNGGSAGTPATGRPVAAVAAVNAQSFARFSTPVRASTATAATDAGLVEIVDASTLRTVAAAYALEGPPTAAIGTARVNVNGRTMAVDATGGNAYVLTASGLSVIPLATGTQPTPTVNRGGVVSNANLVSGIAPGGLISILGSNLASSATAAAPLPGILGGTCVTLNNTPLPLMATAPGQINAQLPPSLAAGSYPLVVRSITGGTASASLNVTVAKYAPAIFMDAGGASVFHADGTRVDENHPAKRDEPLTIYATGLGATTGGRVTAGQPSPSDPLAVTAAVQLFFGNPTIKQAAVIVDWSGLAPGYIGVYQINARVPGFHMRGSGLPVTLRIGGIATPTTGPGAALVWVN